MSLFSIMNRLYKPSRAIHFPGEVSKAFSGLVCRKDEKVVGACAVQDSTDQSLITEVRIDRADGDRRFFVTRSPSSTEHSTDIAIALEKFVNATSLDRITDVARVVGRLKSTMRLAAAIAFFGVTSLASISSAQESQKPQNCVDAIKGDETLMPATEIITNNASKKVCYIGGNRYIVKQ